ncbi:MAG TPA: tRNA uridine-5-carboxymethylaminomethyl(34) synthesis GTPase MnmE [Chitinophagaceae bacterium]|nr:tRNA uridine-5-carboxymethylaminomethyl(34) synthesis GTPase MnmE [Chitinophagaceae bacterium]MCC6635770.1 tRNA uridine-5-carboxymethylaminomethyl(34) synthesis GTPase MnmE [Chitinophagaceae bacterium]HNF29698.1 tRNA uridine-5-carboxymethylaminomethyl(34) synthesis GTPase MnmE [Chitinophagaceae bacterium]HNL82478.1 tRNA uridine-5-carboxymethylaminomethyl(34) synthesis GTPase MnmE [Chitinophagaceae bacterium]HNM35041.1 tRNA uridine-5-carboxymethylaminomethyl(34) synthesis GTPase MnmE [Chitino
MATFSDWKDTIVALATPQGVGAIGVIRVSGESAIDIVDKLFPSKNLNQQTTHTLHVGLLKNNNEVLDEVVVALYKAPKSFTGENVVEISCHGSYFIQEKIIETLTSNGCRIAKAGEFTQRAFLNGKLDLTQAEAVADLIASNSEASRNTAINNMKGNFSEELKKLREELIKFSALIELELDFSQEDVEFADRTQFIQLINKLLQTTKQLAASFKLGNVIKNGVQVAIIGKPNAGKSTLLNTLLNEERAIVSDIAGTTRDTIEEVLNIDGILFRLIDTAGIRKHTVDDIEAIGIGKSFEKAEKADIVLYIYDATYTEKLEEEKQWLKTLNKPYILIANKADKIDNKNSQESIYISAKEKVNIDLLKQKLIEKTVGGEINTEATIITNIRHYDALQKLNHYLQETLRGLEENISGDLLALDIRQCLHHLGEITGEITNEDQLDYIFSKFCIGK